MPGSHLKHVRPAFPGATRDVSNFRPDFLMPRPTLPAMSTVGDLVVLTDGRWMVRPPTRCPAGHQLAGADRVLVGHQPCGCGGHTTWRCLVCDAVIYGPPLVADCTVLAGPAAVRTV